MPSFLLAWLERDGARRAGSGRRRRADLRLAVRFWEPAIMPRAALLQGCTGTASATSHGRPQQQQSDYRQHRNYSRNSDTRF
jgi:hypothetical protein